MRAAGLPGSLSGVEGSRPEAGRREAAADRRREQADRWELGIDGVKYACDFNGYYGGRRAPLLAVTGDERAEIEGLLAEIRN